MYSKKRQIVEAFTLVELLVVISIIAMLLAVLMPSLNKARNIAKAAVCMSNLKQISLAFNIYVDGPGSGRFPTKWEKKPDNPKLKAKALYPMQILLYKSVGANEKVFLCPTCPKEQAGQNQSGKWIDEYDTDSRYAGTPYYQSYGYNVGMSQVKFNDIRAPASKILVADVMMAYDKRPLDFNLWGPHWTAAPFASSIIADWHDGKSNIMFSDFSVARHPSKEQYKDKELYNGWWPGAQVR